ncbi:hypothetical protein JW707_04635 [Candidatus Woesearchaeota archaeon]|nr:hypothetical protein [Candidatus Woesearchaeota archaeon]
MSEDCSLEYRIYPLKHGRLSGEIAVTGVVTDNSRGGIERRILVHSCMVNGEMIDITKNADKLKKMIFDNLARYGEEDSIPIYVESVFIEGGPFDCRKTAPNSDIYAVEGNMGVVASEEMIGLFAFSGEVIRAIGPLVASYEKQYNRGSIDFETMKRMEGRICLPAYWFCTRRAEKLRRLVRKAREDDDIDTVLHYGKKIEWWTKLMQK